MTNSPVMRLIKERRSIRRFLPDPVPRSTITQIIEAAIWAPSAHNRQPWRFAIIIDTHKKHQLAQAMGARLRSDLENDNVPEAVIEKDVRRSFARITGAPAIVIMCLSMNDMDTYPDETRATNEYIMAVQSTAMAGQNLLLAAHSAGLGACWMCAPLFCPDVVRDTMDLPHDWQAQGLVTIGFPAEERAKTRKPIEESMLWR